jgi:hypothetical protein
MQAHFELVRPDLHSITAFGFDLLVYMGEGVWP